MSVNLVLLANSTTCNEMLDRGREARPPEVTLKDRLSVEDPMWPERGEEWIK